MLYLVTLNNKTLFKGNYYECLEWVEGLQVGADKVSIKARK